MLFIFETQSHVCVMVPDVTEGLVMRGTEPQLQSSIDESEKKIEAGSLCCSLGCPGTLQTRLALNLQRSACLCLLTARIKSVQNHAQQLKKNVKALNHLKFEE